MAPLSDSRGVIPYFIGAQVDVSGLVKECSDLESLQRLVIKIENEENFEDPAVKEQNDDIPRKDEFRELSEMLNLQELDTVRKWGSRMHRDSSEESQHSNFKGGNWTKPRRYISSSSPDETKPYGPLSIASDKLTSIYENYLLVRPHPNLRILFASPSLRTPGILQSSFMSKIGGNGRVREELTQALADGRGVTAKIRWISKKSDTEGRQRWIHCTPLLGNNGAIGVWMIVVADDENSINSKRFKLAPPVDPKFGRAIPFGSEMDDSGSLRTWP